MVADMDKFRSLALFMTTVETGSFAATAKKHATDPSTVSKAIKRLEIQIGLQLFFRSTRKLSLTSAGEKYAQTVGSLYQELETVEDDLKSENEDASGFLKINLPVSYGQKYILPMLAKFKALYSDIELDISFNDAYVDMIGDRVDVSIRSGSLPDSRLIAQKLTPLDFVICRSSKLDGDPIEINSQFLSKQPWVLFRFKQTGKTMPINFEYKSQKINVEVENYTIVDDGEALSYLCSSGAGLAIMPHFTAKNMVDKGYLSVVCKADGFEGAAVYIVYPKRDFLPKRTRLFIDFIKVQIAEMGESPNNTWLDNS